MSRFDIIVVADPRFPGGTSTAVASELRAAARAGYSTGLLGLKGPLLRYPHPVHPEIAAALDDGDATWVDAEAAASCELLLLHHPQILTHLPVRRLDVEAGRRLLVVHHPPLDGEGAPFYDVDAIAANAEAAFAHGGEPAPIEWAPVGPAVRQQLERLEAAPPLFQEDWVNIVDPACFATGGPAVEPDGRITIGRHSRPDAQKWPETRQAVLEAYPDDPDFRVRVLGGGAFLDKLMQQRYPAGWEVLPFKPGAAALFLRTIELFVYYHHPRWVEAFGRTIIEAMAAGVPALLPAHFAPLFGEAAAYAERHDAAAAARALHETPERRALLAEAGRQCVHERFAPAAHVARLRRLIGPPRPANQPSKSTPPPRSRKTPAATPSPARRKVLFVTSNGIGLGHLTRCMAVARRLDPHLEPVIATMSQAARLAADAGFLVHFIPFHAYLQADQHRWNHFLRLELGEILALLRPAVIVFDGNVPYGGLVAAMREEGRAWRVWMRRGMWREGSGENALAREDAFDAVIEPADLAARLDTGPTRSSLGRTRQVAPIRLVTEGGLGRAAARLALDLPLKPTVILVQLGAGNNFDLSGVLRQLGRTASLRPDVLLVVVASPIAELEVPVEPPLLLRRRYPLGDVLAAFDGAISAVGYNSFHELVLGGVPTLFIPNEHPMMDDQLRRAQHAAASGWSLLARASDPYAIARALEQLLDGTVRAQMAQRLAQIDQPPDGAAEAAQIIGEMARIIPADGR